MKKPNANEIGLYINYHGYTDVYPLGKIIGIKGSKYLIQRIVATKQTAKLEFHVGGFAAHCSNQHAQKWEFETLDEIVEERILKNNGLRISNRPIRFNDYNF